MENRYVKLHINLWLLSLHLFNATFQPSASVVSMPDTSGSPYRRFGEGTSNGKVDDPADKYGKLYEENMNPFTQFHRRVGCSLACVSAQNFHIYTTFVIRRKIADTMR
jgi:hypothetical protein